MDLRAIGPVETDRAAVRSFLAAHADPLDDLLVWADVGPPLGRISSVWLGRRAGEDVAVAFAFPLWPDLPSLGVKGRNSADEREAIARFAAVGPARGYVICSLEQQAAWAAAGRAEPGHREAHMALAAADWGSWPTDGVREASFAEVDAFYRAHGAGAWHPLQFETGPFVVAEHAGEIVAAAGTHFAYPALAQVGNVLTAPAWRGRGFAARCTAAVVDRLVARGHATISLFVETGNTAARRVYERLGFAVHRELAAFAWSRTSGQ